MKQLLLSFLVLTGLACFAQTHDVRITKITDELGVDIPSTFGMVEDPYGFIWFGTVGGLYRFDGKNTKVYRKIKNDSTSLSNSTIRTLLLDSLNQKIYIGTQQGGLNVFDLKDHSIEYYLNIPNDSTSIGDNNVWSLMQDNEGNIWVGMENSGLSKFIPSEGKFYQIPIITEKVEARNGKAIIRMLYQDSKGNIYVGTDRYGLYIIAKNGEITNLTSFTHSNVFSVLNASMWAVEDKNGIVWIATYGSGVVGINPDNKKIIENINQNNGLISNLAYSLDYDEKDRLWVGTEYGLNLIDREKNKVSHFEQSISKPKGLTDNRIRKLLRDSNGILWIGSEAGVDKLIEQTKFKIYQHNYNDIKSMPKGIIRSVFKDNNGIIWIGLIDKGLVKYDPKSKRYTHYNSHKNVKSDFIGYQISAIYEDSRQNLWIGDWDNGLLKFNPPTKTYERVINAFDSKLKLTDNRIQAIVEASPGVLWIGTENGINRYDYSNNTIDYITHNLNDSNSLSGNGVQSQALKLDSKGNIWVGTWSNGLNFIKITNTNPLKYKVTRFKEKNNPKWNQMNHVISLYLQNDTTLWIGTFGNGLYEWHIEKEILTQYDINSGLPNNIIYSILPGDNNTLWLSTDYGLSAFDIFSKEFTNYDASDGLQDNHFFWGAASKANDGELFFGGINGLNSFYPNNLKPTLKKYPVLLTGLNIFHIPYKSNEPIEVLNKITLAHDQNFLTFNFAILDYFEPSRNSFRVKLEGLETEWNMLGKQRTVNYSNLTPGNYKLIIQASGSKSNWELQTREIKLVIKKPWWQKTWARISFILLFLFIGYSIYYIRIRVLTMQKIKLTEMVKKRTWQLEQKTSEVEKQKDILTSKNNELEDTLKKLSEANEKVIQSEKMASIGILAAGVAHEINNPLNFIKGGLQGIKNHFDHSSCEKSEEQIIYLNAIHEGIQRAADIVSSLGQFSRSDENVVEACDIHEVLKHCLVILNNQIKQHVTVKKQLCKELPIVLGNVGKLHQAFFNILTNAEQAIEGKGEILIQTLIENNNLTVAIIDNGIGIPQKELKHITEPFYTTKDPGKGTGLGLSISYRILDEHGGNLSFKSKVGIGTQVIISLPLLKE